MSEGMSSHSPAFEEALDLLGQARQSVHGPQQFWKECLESLAVIAGAEFGLLLLREGDIWKKIGIWPVNQKATLKDKPLIDEADQLGDAAVVENRIARQLKGGQVVAVRLQTDSSLEVCVAAFRLPTNNPTEAERALEKLSLVADTPAVYQRRQAVAKAEQDVQHFASALDLNIAMNERKRFLEVALTLCNELCARHECDQVSLGWLAKDQYIKLQTISHMEKFDRKMDAVRILEVAMEESLEQDEEVVLPRNVEATQITRDHEKLKEQQGHEYICSVPIRVDGKPEAVITCQRFEKVFEEPEVRLLRVSADLAARRLFELKRNDRWFGARWLTRLRTGFAKVVGVEKTWEKIFSILGIIAVAYLFFGRLPYRVEAPFILKSDSIQYVPSPFDGHIAEVGVEVGDEVTVADTLLTLDQRDLLLEEAAALADEHRYLREVEKARAANDLAEMRIAQSQSEQASARLELVRHRLGQAAIKPRFDGIVVEGDLKERLGAPVKAGEVLFRVARIDDMYVECGVSERDIHEIRGKSIRGQIAFAGNPKEKFSVELVRVEPVAVSSADGNVFHVKCAFAGEVADWWRPGMSGVAKFDLGKRNNFWIVSHRTVDFLRMKLWW